MKKIALLFLFLILLIQNSTAAKKDSDFNSELKNLRLECNRLNIRNSYECFQKIEETEIKKNNDKVKRINSDILVLNIDNNTKKTLQNNTEKHSYYTLITYIPEIKYYVVNLHYYESVKTIFISKVDGKEYKLKFCDFWIESSIPSFSGSNEYFTCLGYPENPAGGGLVIYKIDNYEIKNKYLDFDSLYFSGSIIWKGDNEFEAEYMDMIDNWKKKRVRLIFKNEKWLKEYIE